MRCSSKSVVSGWTSALTAPLLHRCSCCRATAFSTSILTGVAIRLITVMIGPDRARCRCCCCSPAGTLNLISLWLIHADVIGTESHTLNSRYLMEAEPHSRRQHGPKRAHEHIDFLVHTCSASLPLTAKQSTALR